MSNIEKQICMKGCRLMTKVDGNPSDVYQFVFNPETKDFSDIYCCSETLSFELDTDGVYEIVTLRNSDAVLEEEGLRFGTKVFDANEIVEQIEGSPI